uniref:Uncharacterized protein n=1 Tax=Rhizophora mucronata TaxID=61149 RepID=A0A2P2M524_RHIMU
MHLQKTGMHIYFVMLLRN